jgi:hypothetical protein
LNGFGNFSKKEMLYNKYYEKYADFADACKKFFNNIKKYKAPLRKLFAQNFHIRKKSDRILKGDK